MTSVSPIADAIKRAKERRRLKPVIDLLRAGFEPTAEEWDALADVAIHGGRAPTVDTEKALEHKRQAVLRYRELRTEGIEVNAALEQAGEEFNMVPTYLQYLANGGDRRI